MAFPIAPSVNDVYVNGGVQYKWNGYAWDVVNTIGTASMFTYEYIATAGQTVFNVNYYAASKYLDVYLNGVRLANSEYTAVDGSTVVLTAGATPGSMSWVAPTVGTVISVGATAPLVSSGGASPVLSITAATISAPGVMTAADKIKLDSIAAGADINVATNLSEGTRTTTTVPVLSSTGVSAVLSAATALLAGVMSAADKAKLDNSVVDITTAQTIAGVKTFSLEQTDA